MNRNRCNLALLAVVLLLTLVVFARADNVQNDVVVGGNDTFTLGGSTTVQYWIVATSGDSQAGCNAIDGTPATVTINVPSQVTASPVSLVFISCMVGSNKNAQSVVFAASAAGDYLITVSVSDSGTGSYNTNPASFTLHVLAPADTTPPVVTITAPAGGAYYKTANVPAGAYSVVEANPYTVVEVGPSTAEGAGSYTVTATDSAGNVGSASVAYTVDDTLPVVTITAPADGGFYKSDVLPALAYTVTESNPYTVVSDGYSNVEGSHTVTVTATDAAGNVGSDSVPYTVDNSAPVVTINAPAAGYYQTATLPALAYTVTDNLDPNPSVVVSGWSTAEGVHTVTVTATDAAGNVGSDSITYTVDNTPPTTDKDLSGTAGSNDWYISDVVVTLTAGDPSPGSGVKEIHYVLDGVEIVVSGNTAKFTVTTEGTNTLDHWAVDNAGNTEAKDSQTINIDKTPPSISGSRSPAANSYGWNNGDVTVSFTCTDAVSGVDSCSGPTTLSGEGAGQSVTGTATDIAGNSASATVGGINIDKTAPTITASISPAAPASTGWYNLATGVPTVSFSCSDDGSGLAGSCPAPVTLSEGADQSVSRTVYDAAGNSATAGISHINVDLTAPIVTITVPANGGFYVLGASVASSFSCADQTSGVASCTGPATVDTNSVGSKSFAVTATDNAGNPATLTNTYNVQYAPVGTMCLGSPSHQILQPINVDGSSVWKKGSTVPAKFRVCDAKGNSIGTPGVVVSFKLVNKDGGTVGPVDEDPVSTTPDIAFRWDPTSQQWIFNINTKNLTAGYTYTYQINLNDGTTIIFKFGLK